MTGRHLGRSVHDLLDGRLDQKATAEAMAHLAECSECSTRYDELRQARERLTTNPAGIDTSFARQLLDREHMAEIAAQEDPHHVRAVRPPDKRPRLLALAAVMALVGGVAAAYIAGAPQHLSAEAASGGANQHGVSTVSYLHSRDLREPDELADWADPFAQGSGVVPVEASVIALPDGSHGLRMTVAYGADSVVVTEQHGRLGAGYSELPTITTDALTLYTIYGGNTTVVWETGDFVISASCSGCETSTLRRVAEAFPVKSQPGVVSRISTGFDELADAVIGTD